MRRTELKIGDWLYLNGEPVRVAEISLATCTVWDRNEDVICVDDYGELTPIPLTEEILEENGWVQWEVSELYTEYHNAVEGYVQMRHYPRERSFYLYSFGNAVTGKQFRYVHEFQHIMWALGMDDGLIL